MNRRLRGLQTRFVAIYATAGELVPLTGRTLTIATLPAERGCARQCGERTGATLSLGNSPPGILVRKTAPPSASAPGRELVESALQARAQTGGRIAVQHALARCASGRARRSSDDFLSGSGIAAADRGAGALQTAAQGTLNEAVARRTPEALTSAFGCRNVIGHGELLRRGARCRRRGRVGGDARLRIQRERRRTVTLEKALELHAQLRVAVVAPSLGLSSRRNHRKKGQRSEVGGQGSRPAAPTAWAPQGQKAKGSPEVGRDYDDWNPPCQSVSRNDPRISTGGSRQKRLRNKPLNRWPAPSSGPATVLTSASR